MQVNTNRSKYFAGCRIYIISILYICLPFYIDKPMKRRSHRSCSVRKHVLRNFAKCTGKRLCQSLFCNKVAGLKPVTLLKKKLWHRCIPLNFAKFLRTSFLQNISERLLLDECGLPMYSSKFCII